MNCRDGELQVLQVKARMVHEALSQFGLRWMWGQAGTNHESDAGYGKLFLSQTAIHQGWRADRGSHALACELSCPFIGKKRRKRQHEETPKMELTLFDVPLSFDAQVSFRCAPDALGSGKWFWTWDDATVNFGADECAGLQVYSEEYEQMKPLRDLARAIPRLSERLFPDPWIQSFYDGKYIQRFTEDEGLAREIIAMMVGCFAKLPEAASADAPADTPVT